MLWARKLPKLRRLGCFFTMLFCCDIIALSSLKIPDYTSRIRCIKRWAFYVKFFSFSETLMWVWEKCVVCTRVSVSIPKV